MKKEGLKYSLQIHATAKTARSLLSSLFRVFPFLRVSVGDNHKSEISQGSKSNLNPHGIGDGVCSARSTLYK